MRSSFGKTSAGIETNLYTIENEFISISVCDFGATLVSLVLKEKNRDVVQGFDSVSGYESGVQYMGQTIGRVCNRIGKGEFELNNKIYHVPINNNGNSLHGGLNGFDRKIWTCEIEDAQICCTYLSKDGEEGYPGNVYVQVCYILQEEGIVIEFHAKSDEDTLFNITNHSFFNLEGPTSTSVLDHEVQIRATQFAGVDSNGCTYEDVYDVQHTAFDFREFKKIGQDIENEEKQLSNGNGYDHHFLVEGSGMREFVRCKTTDIEMIVSSDLPGFHMYSSNYLDGSYQGKASGMFPRRSSVCFETQYYPNAIQTINQMKPILKKGECWHHSTQLQFKVGGSNCEN